MTVENEGDLVWKNTLKTFIGGDQYSFHGAGTDYSNPTDPIRETDVSTDPVPEAGSTSLPDTPVQLVPQRPILRPIDENSGTVASDPQRTLNHTSTQERVSVGAVANVGDGRGSPSGSSPRVETYTLKDNTNKPVKVVYGTDALAFLKGQEGPKHLKPYKDADSYSVGYGHYLKSDIERGYLIIGTDNIPISQVFSSGITSAQADTLFAQDVAVREERLQRIAPNYNNLNENQKTAILSYYYNCGFPPGNPGPRTATFIQYMKDGNWAAISNNIRSGPITQKGSAGPVPGLVKRRTDEANLFDTAPAS